MNKRIKEYFSNKTAEQIFSLCLLVTIIILMLFCMITRLCGGLWFSADLSQVPIPNETIQTTITASLFALEMIFIYKILCRTIWIWCILLAYIQTIIVTYMENILAINIVNILLYFIIPLCITRRWFTLIDSAFLYLTTMLYGLIFLVGRIGSIENANFNFVYGILGMIDYKLFIFSMYLYIKNFGGIKLWKKQKKLICQKDL